MSISQSRARTFKKGIGLPLRSQCRSSKGLNEAEQQAGQQEPEPTMSFATTAINRDIISDEVSRDSQPARARMMMVTEDLCCSS